MKFLYVVDHPSRDLPSYAWWAISSGFHSHSDTVALISMNDINRDVIVKTSPDIIFWNYARPNNIKLIRAASRLGIYNIIHDTEGIPYDTSSYYLNLKSSDFLFINEIWTWGQLQLQHLQKRFEREGISTLIKKTGSIRYAYANQLPKVDLASNNTALWNTNFPLLSPRYNSFESEFAELCQKHLVPLADSLDFVRIASECRIYAIYKCIDIACRLPYLNIVLRTHPFEAKDFYLAMMSVVNLSLSADHDVNDDIYSSSFILHSGCQTSLDAYFRGVPSFVFSHSNACIWASTSCKLPLDLGKLMDADFLYSSLIEQRQLFSKFGVELYLENLSDGYDHLSYFTLEHLVFPSKKYCFFWKVYFNVRTVVGRILRLFSRSSRPRSSRISLFTAKKLSSSGIASYITGMYKISTATISNCVYILPEI